jgi:signal transduction histidine kinase
MLVVASGAILSALFVGWWLAGRALAPAAELERQLSSIGVGELGRRVEVSKSDDELGRLSSAINSMLTRIDDGFHRQRAFVTAASHDLRTPIAALRTELELAAVGRPSRADLRAAIERAHGDAIRLGNLANDLLALAESEPGGRAIFRQPVPVDVLVRECADDQAGVASAHDVNVDVSAPSDEVVVDRSRIEQAIRNLLANAIRYSPRGATVEILASVQQARGSESRRKLTVEVLDRGPGVPATIRQSLFLPFAARSGDGHSGLGLATAAAAVRAHGGAISYADRSGGGAQFAFTVPA